MHCYDEVETCYTSNSLDKFKIAALEFTVKSFVLINDDIGDTLPNLHSDGGRKEQET